MGDLLASDLLGNIISSIATIIAAIITKKVTNKAKGKVMKRNQVSGKTKNYIEWVIVGVVAACTFIIISLAYNILTPGPTVEIASPENGEGIEVRIAETGSGSFSVNGSSTRVADKTDLRVYVLVHPSDPFAEGWWIQAAVVMNSDGNWSGQAWIGDPASPPHAGDIVDVITVVAAANQTHGSKVSDPKDLNPAAQSSVVRFNIKSTGP